MAVSVISFKNRDWGVIRAGGEYWVTAIVGTVHYSTPPSSQTFWLYNIYINGVLVREKTYYAGAWGSSGNGSEAITGVYEGVEFSLRVDELECFGTYSFGGETYTVGDTTAGITGTYTINRATVTGPSPADGEENVALSTPANPVFTWEVNYALQGANPEHIIVYFYALTPAAFYAYKSLRSDVDDSVETYTRLWNTPDYLYGKTCTWRVVVWNQWGSNTYNYSFAWAPEGYVPPTDPFPEPRPDPPDDDPYPGMSITGGGRFGTTLLVISNNSDVGVIYYRTV